MKRVLLLLFIVLLNFCIYAQGTDKQQAIVDSLKTVINTTTNDTTKIKAYKVWSNLIYLSNPALDLEINEKIQAICIRNLKGKLSTAFRKIYKEQLASAKLNIGSAYKDRGDYDKAYKMYSDGLQLFKEVESDRGVASAYNNLGIIARVLGNDKKAIEYYMKGLKMVEEMGDNQQAATTLLNIGNIFAAQGSYNDALEYFFKSLELQKKIDSKYLLSATLSSIGIAYTDLKNYEKALEYHHRSLKESTKANYKRGVAQTYKGIALVHLKTSQLDTALKYYKLSLTIREELNNKHGIAYSLKDIANVYLEMENLNEAKAYAKKSLLIAQENHFLDIIREDARALYKCYKNEGNYVKSLEMFELFIQMRDSITSEQNQKEVIRQQYKYEYEKQAAADSVKAAEATKVKDAQLTAQRAENAQQQQQAYYLYGGLALALLFGGFIFNRFRVTNKQKKVIQHQKTEVEKQREFADEQRMVAEQQKEVVEEKNKEIIDSINYAKRLQEAILPPQKLVKEYLQQSFILYKPKDIVAGDFYWMETFAPKGASVSEKSSPPVGELEGAVYFAAADCTGHGVPGAMVSVICSNALSKALIEENITDVGKLLDRTRELVIERFGRSEENIQDGMDIALCKLSLPPKGGAGGGLLEYAGANNPLWIINPNRTKWPKQALPFGEGLGGAEIKADKQPIGKYDAEKPFTTHTIQLKKGDSIYIFSDGYPDQFGGDKGKKYKTGAMKRYLLSIQDKDMATQHQLLNQEFENWKGDLEQIDDVCMIGVRV